MFFFHPFSSGKRKLDQGYRIMFKKLEGDGPESGHSDRTCGKFDVWFDCLFFSCFFSCYSMLVCCKEMAGWKAHVVFF